VIRVSTFVGKSSVADPGCLSQIPDPTFFHPGSELSPSRILIKEFKYFYPKKAKKRFLTSKKYDPGCSSRIRMLTFSHPGSRGQKVTQSRIPDPQHWVKGSGADPGCLYRISDPGPHQRI
jgi:hypothetical protein